MSDLACGIIWLEDSAHNGIRLQAKQSAAISASSQVTGSRLGIIFTGSGQSLCS